MPGLAIMLSLRQSQRTSSDVVMLDANTDMNELSSVVVFVCGLLLGNDQDIRIWFAQHIKSAQKVYTLLLEPCHYYFSASYCFALFMTYMQYIIYMQSAAIAYIYVRTCLPMTS